MATQQNFAIAPDQYLAQERQADTKSEYYQGEIVLLAGASERHNTIVANVLGELRTQLKGRPCKVYPSDMRLRVKKPGSYTYPDVMVCEKREFDDQQKDTLLNPTIILEVLSETTEDIDRGRKFDNYRQIGSLKEYLLISQDDYSIEQYVRKNGNQWLFTETKGLNETVHLDSISCVLSLSEVYDKAEE